MLVLLFVSLFLVVRGQSVEEDVLSQGYPSQTYNVTTADGYILRVHRIPYGKSANKSSGKVVFLMHGAPYSSSSFINGGSNYAMAYNLADAGYDVWMGNARGNRYSRHHISLDPEKNSSQFWDFTYEEIGLYDLPAIVDYALATTKQDKLHFVGHSLGATSFLVLNTMNTTYQSKFISAHLLAGLGYETAFPNPTIKVLGDASDVIYDILKFTDNMEMTPINLTSIFLQNFVNFTVPRSLYAGTSVKQLIHLGQNVRDKAFRRWYDVTATTAPPSYDLTKIKTTITLHYSQGDTTLSETDTLAMATAMPNAKARKVARDSFGNLDYFTSKDAKDLVTAFIIDSFTKF